MLLLDYISINIQYTYELTTQPAFQDEVELIIGKAKSMESKVSKIEGKIDKIENSMKNIEDMLSKLLTTGVVAAG